MVINGFCDPKFSKIKDAYERNFINGQDVGSSLGITFKGELVVYLWGGFKDKDQKIDCRDWIYKGACPRGAKCSYYHDLCHCLLEK